MPDDIIIPRKSPPKFRASLAVSVWLDGDIEEHASVVEVILDDPFTWQDLDWAGSTLQRGAYSALEGALKQLLSGGER